MMRPPCGDCACIARNAACAQRKAPVRLVSMTRRHTSGASSATGVGGAAVPALLNSTSSLPNLATVRSTMDATAAASVTSTESTRTFDAAPDAMDAVSSSGADRRPARATA